MVYFHFFEVSVCSFLYFLTTVLIDVLPKKSVYNYIFQARYVRENKKKITFEQLISQLLIYKSYNYFENYSNRYYIFDHVFIF